MATVTDLPRITRYLYKTDGGPCDDGPSATCPHCGSGGRYVHYFEVEGGQRAAAMSGCITLFPMSEIARADMALTEKERELAEKKWNPNSWQKKIREAIDAHYAGDLSEADALRIISLQKAAQAQYYAKKRGGRGRF